MRGSANAGAEFEDASADPIGRIAPAALRQARKLVHGDWPWDDTGVIDEGRCGSRSPRIRAAVAWILGVAGLLAYNWWLLVPLKPALMRSPDELFSNLEVTGQPLATAMQNADLAAGLLLLGAFCVAGIGVGRKPEWLAMIGFSVAGVLGGLFPEVCADAVNAACRRAEFDFQLPASQYIHMIAGILEFAAITLALLLAVRRTAHQRTRIAMVYRGVGAAALIAYPLLGLAYVTDRMGGVMEAVFFAWFTFVVVTQLAERISASSRRAPTALNVGPDYCRV